MGKNPIRIDHADGIFYGQRGKNADVPNSYLFLVSGPFAADIFEPRSRAYYMGGADGPATWRRCMPIRVSPMSIPACA